MVEIKFKSDKYKKSRGGHSRLLDIQCGKCGVHLFYYQKDGIGILKRIYLDRIIESNLYSGLDKLPLKKISQLTCPNCKQLLGIPYVYEKEKRLAFRLFTGSVSKKVFKSK
ncbi:MAG: hypothetical protein WC841_04965 [Candidatus Shapirobacteria bacterium]